MWGTVIEYIKYFHYGLDKDPLNIETEILSKLKTPFHFNEEIVGTSSG